MAYESECKTRLCEDGRRPCPTPTTCGRYVEPAEACTEVGQDDYNPVNWAFVKFMAAVIVLALVGLPILMMIFLGAVSR